MILLQGLASSEGEHLLHNNGLQGTYVWFSRKHVVFLANSLSFSHARHGLFKIILFDCHLSRTCWSSHGISKWKGHIAWKNWPYDAGDDANIICQATLHTQLSKANDVTQQEAPPPHRERSMLWLKNCVNSLRCGTAPRGYGREDVWMEEKNIVTLFFF